MKFWLMTAVLVTLLIIGGYYVINVTGFSGILGITHVLYAAGIMALTGVIAYISIGRVISRLARDDYAMGNLEKLVQENLKLDATAFRKWVLHVCHNPEVLGGRSRVGDALRLLATRHAISRVYKVKTPINRSVFQNDFEEKVGNDGGHLGNIMVFFFMAGFFALVAVIYITFVGLPHPKTLEEIAQYTSNLLNGLGLSYLLTLLGIGMGLLTQVIKMLIYDPHSGKIFDRFREINFSVIFPILQSSMAEDSNKVSDGESHEEK